MTRVLKSNLRKNNKKKKTKQAVSFVCFCWRRKIESQRNQGTCAHLTFVYLVKKLGKLIFKVTLI